MELRKEETCSYSSSLSVVASSMSSSSQIETSEKIIREMAFMKYVEDVIQRKSLRHSWSDVCCEFTKFFPHFIEELAKYFQALSGNAPDLSEGSEIMRIYNSIAEKVKTFNNFPFTWLIFCELIHDSTSSYKKMEPFMRSLQRVINIETISTSSNEEIQFGTMECILFKEEFHCGKKIDRKDYLMEGGVDEDVDSIHSDEEKDSVEIEISPASSHDEEYCGESSQNNSAPYLESSEIEDSLSMNYTLSLKSGRIIVERKKPDAESSHNSDELRDF